MKKKNIVIQLLFFVILISNANAGSNTRSFVKKFENQVRSSLKKGDLNKANELFVHYFDMPRFSKRCLIDHWDNFTSQEKNKFIDLFDKNLRKRVQEKMLLTKQDNDFSLIIKQIDKKDNIVVITTSLKITKGDFKLVLFLIQDEKNLKMLDYELEDALLSRNYRSHFNFLIKKYGKKGLFNRLEKKLNM